MNDEESQNELGGDGQKAAVAASPPGCSGSSVTAAQSASSWWIQGQVATPAGLVPRIDTSLTLRDRLGSWKARWDIGRMNYRVAPGLYAVGQPTPQSPVFVTANYKMSFDRLRSCLAGVDGWVLVLQTQGINVWCAAGKGTFGTDEIVRRIEQTRLGQVVAHRKLIVPQLGAVGVAAHEVKERSGFGVIYGPVRAADVPAFLAAGHRATPAMRRVEFPLWERVVLAPVELMHAAVLVLAGAAALFLLAGLANDGFAWERVAALGVGAALLFLLVSVASIVLTAALLPWLPGRAFAVKGFWLGLAFLAPVLLLAGGHPAFLGGRLSAVAWSFLIPALASFLAMNFTGATTFTSLSGVRLETRLALPLQAACACIGGVIWLTARFVDW